jgi:hypothetical protein
MPATRHDIAGWCQEAQDGGARWLVIKCDQFDYRGAPDDKCCYPVALTRADEVWKVIENGDRTMEVYDLSLSLESQMGENRAWHPPERSR